MKLLYSISCDQKCLHSLGQYSYHSYPYSKDFSKERYTTHAKS